MFIAESFVIFNVSHIKRQGNFVAHNFARYISDLSMWMKDILHTFML